MLWFQEDRTEGYYTLWTTRRLQSMYRRTCTLRTCRQHLKCMICISYCYIFQSGTRTHSRYRLSSREAESEMAPQEISTLLWEGICHDHYRCRSTHRDDWSIWSPHVEKYINITSVRMRHSSSSWRMSYSRYMDLRASYGRRISLHSSHRSWWL